MEVLSLFKRDACLRVVVSLFLSLLFSTAIYTNRIDPVNDHLGSTCNPINLGVPNTENFDTLVISGTGTIVPPGWLFSEALSGMNTTYSAGTGSSTSGDTYSLGPAGNSDRAFGGLQTGSLVPTVGACFVNNTGAPITSLNIAYEGEQWRLGAIGRSDRLDFEYSVDATSLTTGTWTAVDVLDLIAPVSSGSVGALDGNVNKVSVTGGISGLALANGATFYIRYVDLNAAGSDDALGVDNFTLTVLGPTSAPVSLSGRVTDASGRGIRSAMMVLEGGGQTQPRFATTGSFGYYVFEDLPVGTYSLTVISRRHWFAIPSRTITLNDNVTDADFIAEPEE